MYAEPARGAALVPALPLLDTIIVTTTMTGVEDDVVTGRASRMLKNSTKDVETW